MGTRYTTQSLSGYNASPPSDDGTVAASNQVSWAKHLSKIGNPLKTLAEAINTQLVAALTTTARSVSVSDSTVAGDHWRTVEIASNATSGVTVSLADAATMTNGYVVTVANQSAFSQTIGRSTATDTINTITANVTIRSLESITFAVNTLANGYIRVGNDQAALNSSGSWTPVITFTTPGNQSIAYSVQIGNYIKEGNKVTLQCSITTSTFTHSTASGSLALTGLPFTPKTQTSISFPAAVEWSGITKSGYTSVIARAVSGSTTVQFIGSGSGQPAAALDTTWLPTGGTVALNFVLTYFTA